MFIEQDARANSRISIKAKLFGDEVWKFILALRRYEYYSNVKSPIRYWYKLKYHFWSLKLGFSIPINVFDSGLSIPHYGTIVVSTGAKIGKNCRIHEGVCIGADGGSDKAAIVGDNVFIGTGAKIIGEVTIASDVAIAANAVVVKSIEEPSSTYGGIPAKKNFRQQLSL